jgi:hypothetical protein
MTGREIVYMVHKGHRNALTPRLDRYGKIGANFGYELSHGESMFDLGTVWGVSVCRYYPADNKALRCADLCKLCRSREAAERYIAELKQLERKGELE